MRTINVNVYQYSELSEKAKERARNWYSEASDFSWAWEDIQYDAKEIGLELTAWEYNRYCKGSLISSAEYVCDKIMSNHGEQCGTYKTAKKYREKFNSILPLYESNSSLYDDKYEELKEEFTRMILGDYRIMTDNQYEYIQSEGYIAEAMEANEYTFFREWYKVLITSNN